MYKVRRIEVGCLFWFTIYIFLNKLAFIIHLKDSTWTNASPTYICTYAFQALLSSKSILPLENVWKYNSVLNNNSWCWKRQSWMQPNHARSLSLFVLFRIYFLINKIVLLFHSQDSATTSLGDATADILTKVDAASSNPPFTKGTETQNDVSIENLKGEIFVKRKLVRKCC